MDIPGSDVPHDVSLTLTERELDIISNVLRCVEAGEAQPDWVTRDANLKAARLVIENARAEAWDRAPTESQAQIDALRREERDRTARRG